MASKIENTSDQLRKELKSLSEMLEEMMQDTGQKSESELQKLRAKAEDMIKTSKDTLAQSSEKIVEQTKDIADKADSYVHEKPWNGMGIAAAVGVVVGVLLARR